MIEIGRLVIKIAGRDAGCKAVIIDILDSKFVLIDGETRRRKCNVLHIEPLNQKVEIKKNASHDEVAKALKELGMEARATKPKPKTQKPLKKRKTPEQLRTQKEEKRKLRDIFKPKKKEAREQSSAPLGVEKAEAKESTLEAKAGLETKERHKHEHPHEHEHKESKPAPKKEAKKPAAKTEKKK